MPVKPKASYKKVKRKALLYDLDLLNQQVLFRVDLIIESVDNITTPVTPLYQARFTDDNPNALPARGFDPRQLTCCFELNTKTINRTVFNPYRPSVSENKGLIRELLNLPEITSLTYTGESHERNYERLV